MGLLEDMKAQHRERYARESADGKHDDQCEQGPRIMTTAIGAEAVTMLWICHCARRRRLAAGLTEPPGPLIQKNPQCPRCYAETYWDEGFVCDECATFWDSSDPEDPGTFTDDYGDLGRPVPIASEV